MKNVNDIMNRLTKLKAWSIAENDPYGWGAADREIKVISDVLKVFGVEWYYGTDRKTGKWRARLK